MINLIKFFIKILKIRENLLNQCHQSSNVLFLQKPATFFSFFALLTH